MAALQSVVYAARPTCRRTAVAVAGCVPRGGCTWGASPETHAAEDMLRVDKTYGDLGDASVTLGTTTHGPLGTARCSGTVTAQGQVPPSSA